ncbi:MAG: GNAT family N-acetyltransferase [Spirochaetes bacterium]|nr:GNAT family N-acetyltransferase [Spirochaetota bacterium]
MVKIKKAKLEDVSRIRSILTEFVEKQIILDRTEKEISEELSRFYIAEEEDSITGTVSYHDYGISLKEIRSLVVKTEKQGSGTGRLLVQTAISDILKSNPESKIFTLTYVPEFFKKLNFIEVDKNTLPEKIWKDCNNCVQKDNCGETALIYNGK